MIGCTKLLCGTATVSEAIKHGRDSSKLPPNMLQFSADTRPLVVWNMTNRCNLRCQHCYIEAEDKAYRNELTTEEAKVFIDDLAEMQAPVLLFSGGEPLLRQDIYELGKYAAERNLRPVISSNGTLITPEMAQRIKDAGFQYVGISLDGLRDVHDEFRVMKGAFDRSIQGIRNCLAIGVKAGVRFTVNKMNYKDLPGVIDLLVEEGVPRFCMYHLVYAGRGKEIANQDLSIPEMRDLIEWLLNKTQELHDRGVEVEILTTDNHADGIYLYNKIVNEQPERADEVMELLKMHGGCSAGKKFADVDAQGNVHACQFWGHVVIGNVKERKFSDIWNDLNNELMAGLKDMKSKLKGRCAVCKYVEVCGGCRIRAEAITGDVWESDPACYLTDEEIGALAAVNE